MEGGFNKKVIAHEYTHYYVDIKFNKLHKHDEVFKKYCLKFGGSLTGEKLELESNIEKPKVKGYAIYCKCCNKRIGFKLRKCKVTNNIENYSCKLCGSNDLAVIREEI